MVQNRFKMRIAEQKLDAFALGDKVRVVCQTGSNQLFDLADLILLAVPQPKKKKRNLMSELRGFGSV